MAPESEFLTGPIQDTIETTAFTFRGTDDQTAEEDIQFECRLLEIELTEAPEPIAPWDPIPLEEQWTSCASPWSVPLMEEGLFRFELRAIDRAGNVEETPTIVNFSGNDESPPQTIIVEKPALVSPNRSATFTFTAVDNQSPAMFMEYECRLDSRDPDMWMECFNPAVYGNLTSGTHTFEVRALDVAEMMDPTPARHTWTVGSPANSDAANVSLTAVADAMVDQVNPADNFLFESELEVKSDATGDALAVPPEPVVGQNGARARPLQPADRRLAVPAREGDAQAVHDLGRDRAHARGDPAGGHLEGEHGHLGQPAGRRRRRLARDFERARLRLLGRHRPGRADAGAARRRPAGPAEPRLPDPRRARVGLGAPGLAGVREPRAAAGSAGADAADPRAHLREGSGACASGAAHADGRDRGHVRRDAAGEHEARNDLHNCVGEGLVAGADDIVIDLNGHTVDGPDYLLGNVVNGQEEGFPAGIRVSGKKNVLVTSSKPGGAVQQFGYGVLMTSGTIHSTVENLTVSRNAMSGVELFDADDGRNGNTVRNNTIHSNELGVSLLAGTSAARVLNNDIFGSLGEAVLIEFSDSNWFENNRMVGIPLDPNLDSDGGVLIRGSAGNTIKGGEIRDTGDAGVGIDQGANDNTVQDVVMYRNGDAGVIVHDSDGTKVINIVAHQESDGGVVLNNANNTLVKDSDLRFNPSGVEHNNSNDVTIEGNDGSDSLQTGFEIGNGLNIKVLNNVANRTGGAGIGVEGGAFDPITLGPIGGALIQGNTTNENSESGISVADGGHTIRANKAYHNAGHGIVAGEAPEAPGEPASGTNIDGGGNQAAGNGAPEADPGNPQQPPPPDFEQCIGVDCTTGDVPPRVGHTDTVPPNTIITKAPTTRPGSCRRPSSSPRPTTVRRSQP